MSVARHGAGTEQLERELEELVAPLPVFRLDSDVAAAAGVATVLRRFDEAPAGVLVGTQMVAKGHDFPDVTLGVVLDADATLRFPDFRAEERTFALVAQLAGRSGRGERGGRVIVQALDPSAEALRFAARHDADGFLEAELRRRELLGYPPHGHLIRVVCSSVEPGPELAAATAIRELTTAAGVPASARRRCSAARGATAPSSCPLRRANAARSRPCATRSSAWPPSEHTLRRASRWTWIRSRTLAPAGVKLGPDGRGAGNRLSWRARLWSSKRLRSSIPRPRRAAWRPCRSSAASAIPILKSSATPVDRFDDSLRKQVSRMAGIMGDAFGVGLAAPQLGLSQRLLVYRVGPDAPVVALANPELEWVSDDSETSTRAASRSPGSPLTSSARSTCRVRALDEDGETRMVEASGLEARVIQHEMDHLDGVLILDRTTRDERKRALRELRDAERARERNGRTAAARGGGPRATLARAPVEDVEPRGRGRISPLVRTRLRTGCSAETPATGLRRRRRAIECLLGHNGPDRIAGGPRVRG